MSVPPPAPFPLDPHEVSWADSLPGLVALSADDLLQDRIPIPTVLAFAGDQPIGVVGLRPFGPGGAGQALLEVLSLLVPLGADRLAFAATGRIWSVDDPIPPVCDAGDLRQRAIVVALADAHEGPCRLTTSVHPFEGSGARLTLSPPLTIEGDAPPGDGPVGATASVLVGALEQRTQLQELAQPADLVAQLGRVLLLGHDLALAPDPAASLTDASVA